MYKLYSILYEMFIIVIGFLQFSVGSSMDAHALARTPYLVRAPLLVREILLALLSEADNSRHPLVGVFGYDKRTFEFIKQTTSSSLLKLASSYVKANAVTFTVNERQLKSLLKTMNSSEQFVNCREITDMDRIYGHRQVVRELVMFMADSLSDNFYNADDLISFNPETRRMLSYADARKLEWLASQMVENRCVKFNFNKDKIRDRTYSHMRYERREVIKDMLLHKQATNEFMAYLFSEENPDSAKARRYRLGLPHLQGRPKSVSPEMYADFICLWTANQDMTELDRFLMIHRKMGYGFDVIFGIFKKALSEGEFEQHILDAVSKCKKINLACQINNENKTS